MLHYWFQAERWRALMLSGQMWLRAPVAWNHGNVYTDHDGNIHSYSDSGERSTYDSGGWHRDVASPSSWGDRFGGMDREAWGRSLGAQRFDSFRRGGGWGGFRGGGFRR